MPGLARARSSSDSGLNTNTNASACGYKMAHIFITNWFIFATTHTQTKSNWQLRVAFFAGFPLSASNWLKNEPL